MEDWTKEESKPKHCIQTNHSITTDWGLYHPDRQLSVFGCYFTHPLLVGKVSGTHPWVHLHQWSLLKKSDQPSSLPTERMGPKIISSRVLKLSRPAGRTICWRLQPLSVQIWALHMPQKRPSSMYQRKTKWRNLMTTIKSLWHPLSWTAQLNFLWR